MFITRESDYAVRILRAMSECERISVNDICQKEEITAPFAYKILKKMEKAGLVKGFRGVKGGYQVAADLKKITLFDIYTAIDPSMFIIECLNPEKPCKRNGHDKNPCLVHIELEEIQSELWKLLRRKSFYDILYPNKEK